MCVCAGCSYTKALALEGLATQDTDVIRSLGLYQEAQEVIQTSLVKNPNVDAVCRDQSTTLSTRLAEKIFLVFIQQQTLVFLPVFTGSSSLPPSCFFSRADMVNPETINILGAV